MKAVLSMKRCPLCGCVFYHGMRKQYCKNCICYMPKGGLSGMKIDDLAELKKLRERQRWKSRMQNSQFRERERLRSRNRYWKNKKKDKK